MGRKDRRQDELEDVLEARTSWEVMGRACDTAIFYFY